MGCLIVVLGLGGVGVHYCSACIRMFHVRWYSLIQILQTVRCVGMDNVYMFPLRIDAAARACKVLEAHECGVKFTLATQIALNNMQCFICDVCVHWAFACGYALT